MPDQIALRLLRPDCTHHASLCLARMTHAELLAQQQAHPFLHADEQSCLDRMQSSARRHSYLMGRYCAKQALAHQIGLLQAQEVAIVAGVFGQPLVRAPACASTRITISHSGDHGCAIAFDPAQPMGIDMEPLSRLDESDLRPLLTPAETHQLDNGWRNEHACTWLWTVKEALGKTLCTGLTAPMWMAEVSAVARDGIFHVATFRHLPQYKALSFQWQGALVSIVLPAGTTLDMPVLRGVSAVGGAGETPGGRD